MSDTPRTDAAYAKVWTFANEEQATEACATMRDLAAKLERENAKLREVLTGVLACLCEGWIPEHVYEEVQAALNPNHLR